MNSKPLYLHTLSPLHVGTGRGTGLVDLPIAREKATGYPILPGSAIKGVIRDAYERENIVSPDVTRLWFGTASDDSSQAGSMVFGDAHILLLPVRAFRGTFAWVTCPSILRRHKRDLENAGIESPDAPQVESSDVLMHSENNLWEEGRVILEDLDLRKSPSVPQTDDWFNLLAKQLFDAAWAAEFKNRFLIVSDETFDFLCEFGTEVRARVRIDDETKTVARGALWYVESLPAETILAGMIWEDEYLSQNAKLLGLFGDLVRSHGEFQFGGKATTGHGRVVVKVGA